jgi:hypothetical protein
VASIAFAYTNEALWKSFARWTHVARRSYSVRYFSGMFYG